MNRLYPLFFAFPDALFSVRSLLYDLAVSHERELEADRAMCCGVTPQTAASSLLKTESAALYAWETAYVDAPPFYEPPALSEEQLFTKLDRFKSVLHRRASA